MYLYLCLRHPNSDAEYGIALNFKRLLRVEFEGVEVSNIDEGVGLWKEL